MLMSDVLVLDKLTSHFTQRSGEIMSVAAVGLHPSLHATAKAYLNLPLSVTALYDRVNHTPRGRTQPRCLHLTYKCKQQPISDSAMSGSMMGDLTAAEDIDMLTVRFTNQKCTAVLCGACGATGRNLRAAIQIAAR
ncbi:hypothetical protein AAKU55_005303 [Oxalobacteraceae bacterium GrIS 1.11]